MPIGLFLCFTPIVLVWIAQERKAQAEEKKKSPGRH